MNPNIKVSLASPADRDKLSIFFEHYQNSELKINRVDCFTTQNFTIVAKQNENIVGICQWRVKENPKAGVAELEELFVKEEYRGQGVGKNILKFTIITIHDYFGKIGIIPRKIYLLVSENNLSARKLYEKLGFSNMAAIGTLFDDSQPELFYCYTSIR